RIPNGVAQREHRDRGQSGLRTGRRAGNGSGRNIKGISAHQLLEILQSQQREVTLLGPHAAANEVVNRFRQNNAAWRSMLLQPDRKSVVLGKECRSRWSPY